MSERFSISVDSLEKLKILHYALREASIRNASPDPLREYFPPIQLLTDIADNPPFKIPPIPPRQVLERLCIAASELTLNIGHNARTLNPNYEPHSPLSDSIETLRKQFPNTHPLTISFGFNTNASYVSVTSPIDSNAQPVNLSQAIKERNSNPNTYSGLAHIQDNHSIGNWESRLYISDHPGPDKTKLRTSGLLTWHK